MSKPEFQRNILVEKEVADLLSVSCSWLQKARLRGNGPPFMRLGSGERGGLIRYHKNQVLEWAATRTYRSTSEY